MRQRSLEERDVGDVEKGVSLPDGGIEFALKPQDMSNPLQVLRTILAVPYPCR